MFGNKKEKKNINNLNNNNRVINSSVPRHENNQQINKNVTSNYQNSDRYNQQQQQQSSRRNNGQRYPENQQGRNMSGNNLQPPMPSQYFQNRQNNFNNDQNALMENSKKINSNYRVEQSVERNGYSHREEERANNNFQPSPNRRNRQPLFPRIKQAQKGKIIYVIFLATILIGLIVYIVVTISQMI